MRFSRGDNEPLDLPAFSFRLVLAAWTVPALLSTFETVMFARVAGQPIETWRAFASEAPGWYAWAALTPLIVMLARRFPLEAPIRVRAVAAHIAGWLFVAVVSSAVWAGVGLWLRPGRSDFASSMRNWFLSGLPFTVLGYAAVVGICSALAHRTRLRQRERDAARLAQELSEAQLAALRSQLQPHFLFNSLNAIMTLVRDVETDRAVAALTILSDILRAALRTNPTHEIALAEEVAFTRNYLEIERIRFPHRLQVSFDVPPALLDAAVPTFVLQPFVENAIKHGLMGRRKGGTISVHATADGTALRLTVKDDGVGLASAPTPGSDTGLGIANARSRLTRLYGAAGSLSIAPGVGGEGVVVEIRVPLARIVEPPPRPTAPARATLDPVAASR
jgi:two-component system LytT family sensor kinase